MKTIPKTYRIAHLIMNPQEDTTLCGESNQSDVVAYKVKYYLHPEIKPILDNLYRFCNKCYEDPRIPLILLDSTDL